MILCCGEALMDMVPMTMEKGIEAYRPCPGGSPYNSAIACGRLGTPTAFLGKISTDFFGEALIKRLSDNGVQTDFIPRSDKTTTLAFVKLKPGEEAQYLFYTEGSADRSLTPQELHPVLPGDVRCILYGSISMTMEPVASAVETLVFREGRRKDPAAPVLSLDPNIRPAMIKDIRTYVQRLETWMAVSTIVKISGADLDYIYPGMSHQGAIEKILTLGPSLVIATLGHDGALAIGRAPDGRKFGATAAIYPVKVVDTIGAGDTFHAGFLSWLEHNNKMGRDSIANLTKTELALALSFANKAASLVCTKAGAEPPTMAEMEAFRVATSR